MNRKQARAGIVAAVREWEGTDYESGGDGRPGHGIDCSALAQRVYQTGAGLTLPRVTYDQIDACHLMPEDEALPADLIFYRYTYPAPGTNGWTHVGVVVGPGRMVDAPGEGARVGERPWYTAYERTVGRPHVLEALPDGDEPPPPSDQDIGEGTVARIDADELRLRAEPSTSARVLGIVPDGSRVIVTRDDASVADGHRWARVATRIGNGWIATDADWFIVEGRYAG
jgi:hypothetical protein